MPQLVIYVDDRQNSFELQGEGTGHFYLNLKGQDSDGSIVDKFYGKYPTGFAILEVDTGLGEFASSAEIHNDDYSRIYKADGTPIGSVNKIVRSLDITDDQFRAAYAAAEALQRNPGGRVGRGLPPSLSRNRT